MTDRVIEERERARITEQFIRILGAFGIDRDARIWDLTGAEVNALLTPLLHQARVAGAAEMQERCASIAESYEPMWPGKGSTIAAAIRREP